MVLTVRLVSSLVPNWKPASQRKAWRVVAVIALNTDTEEVRMVVSPIKVRLSMGNEGTVDTEL